MITSLRVHLLACALLLPLCVACVGTVPPARVPTTAPTATPIPAPTGPSVPEPPADAPTIEIRDGTQGAIAGEVFIGAGNFWEADYVDESGRTQHGLTVGLWITVKDDPSANQTIRMHVGETIIAGTYRVKVLDIQPHQGAKPDMPGSSNALVRLAYAPAATPAP